MSFSIQNYQFDLLIIGAGGAGLTSAITAYDSGVTNMAVISKVLPTSSHTTSAKGGINASLGNVAEDDWRWHAYDTIKGSDYLADYDAVEILCQKANEAILFLEKNGVIFSRDENGKIAQRAYGAQSTNFGEGDLAFRACYSKDKTGHSIIHTLYQQALRREIRFFNEFFVIDLIVRDKNHLIEDKFSNNPKNLECLGCIAIDCNRGELAVFQSREIILATGGYSQIYRNTTSSVICTGDGNALALRAGFALQDMEFVQFHPTGIFGQGFLITEAARSEGAYLLNKNYERFMVNYAPKMMEMASRDVISLAMAKEIKAGRAASDQYLYLDMRHLNDEILSKKIPGVVELVRNFAALDVKKDLIPITPSAHYNMGGVPTDLDCQILQINCQESNENNDSRLFCIGENACLSVHGANRLGCNSLLDLIVFGKIAGKKASEKITRNNSNKKPEHQRSHHQDLQAVFLKIVDEKITEFERIFDKNSEKESPNLAKIKIELQENNDKNLGVIRNFNSIQAAQEKIAILLNQLSNYRCFSQNLIWNEELISYLELQNLLLNSLATAISAKNRQESRGAHFRDDFSSRDDENFLAHSQVFLERNITILSPQRLLEAPVFNFRLVANRTSSSIPDLQIKNKIRRY